MVSGKALRLRRPAARLRGLTSIPIPEFWLPLVECRSMAARSADASCHTCRARTRHIRKRSVPVMQRDGSLWNVPVASPSLNGLNATGTLPIPKKGPTSSAIPQLKTLSAQHGIQPGEADKHFVLPLPKHPLHLMAASAWAWGTKIKGGAMEIDYTDAVTGLERTIMLPFLGQGASMAFEDAYVLSRELCRSAEDVPRALRAYDSQRIPRTAKVQLTARKQGEVFLLTSPLWRIKRWSKIVLWTKAGWQNRERSGCIAMIRHAASGRRTEFAAIDRTVNCLCAPGPHLPTCALHKSGSASWGTSDVPLMLSAQRLVTRT
jgi:hypothetical protein